MRTFTTLATLALLVLLALPASADSPDFQVTSDDSTVTVTNVTDETRGVWVQAYDGLILAMLDAGESRTFNRGGTDPRNDVAWAVWDGSAWIASGVFPGDPTIEGLPEVTGEPIESPTNSPKPQANSPKPHIVSSEPELTVKVPDAVE